MQRSSNRVALSLLLILGIDAALGLRGLDLPYQHLFPDISHDRGLLSTTTVSNGAGRSVRVLQAQASPKPAANNTDISGLTIDGLKEELKEKAHELEDEEQHHSKATVAAAATLGSLLLVALGGCAGMLVYKRFVNSQHAASRKKGAADKLPVYDADRLLGESAASL